MEWFLAALVGIVALALTIYAYWVLVEEGPRRRERERKRADKARQWALDAAKWRTCLGPCMTRRPAADVAAGKWCVWCAGHETAKAARAEEGRQWERHIQQVTERVWATDRHKRPSVPPSPAPPTEYAG